MSNFDDFLITNGLKKGEIADYLHVSNAFITQLCSGKRPIPNDKLALIKANTHGWDVSMLTRPQVTLQSETMANNALIDYLQKKIAELEQKIDKLNSEKADLLQENAVLRFEKLMTSKDGGAQDAEDFLSADTL